MSISETVMNHLKNNSIDYFVVRHPHSSTSLESASSAHVDANQIAKGVLGPVNTINMAALPPQIEPGAP